MTPRGGTWLAALALGLACGGDARPAEMPTVVAPTCAEGAECGPTGRCAMEDGSAVCTCGNGWARAEAHRCVELIQREACLGPRCDGEVGCTAPEHCSADEVCERLTGRCLPRSEVDESGAVGPTGTAGAGDFCYVRGGEPVRGCGDLDARDHCGEGLTCVPSGPLNHTVVCGYPERQPGVCRPTCNIDAPFCELGRGCMFVEGSGGVCIPLGYVDGDCGEGLCQPGSTCVLGGALHGVAHGECRVPCENGERCPDGTGECVAPNESFPEATFCGE
jgi:hypothetical protein